MSKERIYVCHTYYHVYIAILKELLLENHGNKQATLVLSTMSNDFETLKDRLEEGNVFEEVLFYEEQHRDAFPQLDFFKKNYGNIVCNMIARIRFTKLFAKLQEPFVPVDFRAYKERYIFCDSDPIGYYLNQNKIPYHALEDGLNCIKAYDTARYDNRGCFRIKALMSQLNLIFIQNGYGKYCIDMEVNDISVLAYPCKKYKELPRKQLVESLTKEEKELLLQIFVKDREKLEVLLSGIHPDEKKVVILTEPLCDLDTRKQIMQDLIETYGKDATVVLKQHPRDVLDYKKEFPECLLIDRTVPMELLNFLGEHFFDQVISVLTQIDAIKFAKEKIFLGPDFLDAYEEPSIHRQNEQI